MDTPASEVTKAQVRGAIETVRAVAEVIQTLGSVPSGHLYAQLCGVMGIETYNAIISILKASGHVTERYHELSWVD